MKKHKIEILVILILSICVSYIFPAFFTHSDKIIVWTGLYDFIIRTGIIFTLLSLAFFAFKPPSDRSKPIPDGHQEFYNNKNQITKKGFFAGGKLQDGTKHVYKKDGSLSHIEIYKNGVCAGNKSI
jgi:hypothetical protein